MVYIEQLTDLWRAASKCENEVTRTLKTLGYQYVYVNSGRGRGCRSQADVLIDVRWLDPPFLNEFSVVLLNTTILRPIMSYIGKPLVSSMREIVLKTFEELGLAHEIKGPKLIFAHIICPHPPYIFGPAGDAIMGADLELHGNVWLDRDLYVDQLRFINLKVLQLLDEILLGSEVDPIIILQADHGPASV